MAKLKSSILGFDIRGSLSKALSFRHNKGQTIAENRPLPKDAKTPAQLSWRIMYQKAVDLWHLLSPEEKTDWERGGTARHMTGFAWFMSQCLKPNPGIYLPLQGGSMQGDIDMTTHSITDLPPPTEDHEPARKQELDTHAANKSAHHSNTMALIFIIDGSGSAITIGEKGHLEIPFACTITQVTLLADQSGSIVVDIWKDTYTNFPPTNADSITAAAPPTITTAQKSQDSALPGWTTAISAGDILAFSVDSCTAITRITLSLKAVKT